MKTESFSLHIAICDDNVGDRKQLERLLQRESDKRADSTGVIYVDSYGSIYAATRSPMIYDAFFIDMISGDITGDKLALRLREMGVSAPIILCVSSIDYRAVFSSLPGEDEKNNILFLDKPIKKTELSDLLNHITSLKSQIPSAIELRGETVTRYVKEDDIIYAKTNGNYIDVYLKDGSCINIRSTLENFYSHLEAYTHYHSASLTSMVNIVHVKKASLTRLTLLDGTILHTSPIYSMGIKRALRR